MNEFYNLYYLGIQIFQYFYLKQQLSNNDNIICEALTNEMVEMSFTFVVNNNEGNYIFKFWNGKDENGQENYLVFEVPIVE